MSASPKESTGQAGSGQEASPGAQPSVGTRGNGTATRLSATPITIDDLPPYSRSLLRIPVPVVVTLAQKRQALTRITELGPGAIIQFDKSCEKTLELDVGGRAVAVGDAVKVGDKIGLRITSMILPGERFETVTPANRQVKR